MNKIKKFITLKLIPFLQEAIDVNVDAGYDDKIVSLLITVKIFDKVIFTEEKQIKL